MKITKNAFGDYFVSENGADKGYTLKIMGKYRVFNEKGCIGYILKSDNEYISYDYFGNELERGVFKVLLLNFFKQKKG